MKEELGIYIHIPFCKRKCYYCDFISYSQKDKKVEYVRALQKEIEKEKDKAINHIVTTIYIGGGTPSNIEESAIKDIIENIKKYYEVLQDAEITIEVNPGTVTKNKLETYKKAGINRLSIGLQSTNNELLKTIGRIHTYEEFYETYKLARELGFNNINVDLMLGLPNQTIEMLEESIQIILKLKPEHISVYSLILEEGTKLYEDVKNKTVLLPNEDTERMMYWKTKELLEENGYIHYEISNFAKKGKESKHNMNCWEQKEYLGFGLSAHSYYNKNRYSNSESLDEYIKLPPPTIHETQNKENEEKEYMMLGLRKIDGVSIDKFKQKFEKDPEKLFKEEIEKLVKQDLITVSEKNIKLTKKGLDFANIVWTEFAF